MNLGASLSNVIETIAVSLMSSLIVASVYLLAYVGWIPRVIGAFIPLVATIAAGATLRDIRKAVIAGIISIFVSFALIVLLLSLPVLLGEISDPELAGFFIDSIIIQVATAGGPVPLHIITLCLSNVVGSIVGGLTTSMR